MRIICATNRDLAAQVRSGTFRQDLFFRLNGITLTIPPLRSRRSEIAPLAREFIQETCRHAGRPTLPMSDEGFAFLESQSWPGNVRELRNAIERAVTLCTEERIELRHLAPLEATFGMQPALLDERATTPLLAVPPSLPSLPDEGTTDVGLQEDARRAARALERRRIAEAMDRCGGNQTRAAQLLRVSRRTLVARLTEYGFARPLKDRRSGSE